MNPDSTDVTYETLIITLLPHQVFTFPLAYIQMLTNLDDLEDTGLMFYNKAKIL